MKNYFISLVIEYNKDEKLIESKLHGVISNCLSISCETIEKQVVADAR